MVPMSIYLDFDFDFGIHPGGSRESLRACECVKCVPKYLRELLENISMPVDRTFSLIDKAHSFQVARKRECASMTFHASGECDADRN